MKLVWYFDFISPFAYLQLKQFNRLPDAAIVEYRPVLLAGLLNHWQNIGPAEIPPKRTFTYKHCFWLAKKQGIPFKMPPAHPFNSLNALRLALANNNDPLVIDCIFDIIWQHGLSLESTEATSILDKTLNMSGIGATNNETMCQSQTVKQQLRLNTEEAAARSVFGVPTFVPEKDSEELFWGLDAFDMLLDYLDNSALFADSHYQDLKNLPTGATRKKPISN